VTEIHTSHGAIGKQAQRMREMVSETSTAIAPCKAFRDGYGAYIGHVHDIGA
jgi:hypothetical protein